MAVTLIDEFVRGGGESSPWPLTSHTPVASGSWTGSSTIVINPDGYIRATTTAAAVRIAMFSGAYGSDDYEVGGVIKVIDGTQVNNRTNFLIRSTSSAGTDGYFAGIWNNGGSFGAYIQINDGAYSLKGSRTFTTSAGSTYYVVASCSGTTIAIAVRDNSTGQWLNTSGSFASATRTNAVTYTAPTSTGQYFGVQTYNSNDPITNGTHIDSVYRSALSEQPPTRSFTATPTSIPSNHAGNITLTLSGIATGWTSETFTVSGVSGTSKVSQSIASGTSATLVVTTGAGTGTLTISDGTSSTTITVAAPALSVSPSSGATNTTPTVTLTGTNTVWTQETAAGLFSVSGGTGASIGTPTVSTDTSATATLTVGSAGGVLTIADTKVTGSTASFTATVPDQSIAVTNSAILWSPGNWYSDGAGAMQSNNVKAASTFARTWNVGAYLRFGFSGASAGTVALSLDCSSLSAITSTNCPLLMVSVSGATPTETVLSAATTSVTIATGVSSGTVKVWLKGTGTLNGSGDRWTTPTQAVKITGLTIPGAASMVAATAKTYKMLVFGDSITEGSSSLSTSKQNTGMDGSQVWSALLADALDAEVGIVGCDSQGWGTSGINNVPTFPLAWPYYSSGLSRLDDSGLLSPMPDLIVINHGKNGVPNSPTITSTLAAIRTAAPNVPMYVVVTFDGSNRSAFTGATMPDGLCKLVDLGSIPEMAGWWLTDGTHPGTRGHARLAAMLAEALVPDFIGGVAYSFGTFGSGRL